MADSTDRPRRALLVQADGAQAAFVAGALAEMARRGVEWGDGAGAGLGAQAAALALLGEAIEGERRWARDTEQGSPLFTSRIAAAQSRLGTPSGVVCLPDPWRLDGWLDPDVLAAHLAPERAGLPARLRARGCRLWIAVEDLSAARGEWLAAHEATTALAGAALHAAAAFPGGWGATEHDGVSRWGGAGAASLQRLPWGAGSALDVVCGFPVPAVSRPSAGTSLFEQVQRRGEAQAAAAVETWLEPAGPGARLVAPGTESWREFAGRDTAELCVEYPLPWERNPELLRTLVAYGGFVAARGVLRAEG